MLEIWKDYQSGDGKCDSCPGQEAPYPLFGLGDPHADVMLIGQEPAYNVEQDTVSVDDDWHTAKSKMENDRQRSVNPLWKHMMRVGLELGVGPRDLYFTNLAKCNVEDFDGCAEHCRGYIPRELAHVDPQALLLYGSKVITSIFDMFDIEWSGTVGEVHCEVFERSSLTLIPCYHWGYAYRQGDIEKYNEEVSQTIANVI